MFFHGRIIINCELKKWLLHKRKFFNPLVTTSYCNLTTASTIDNVRVRFAPSPTGDT